MAELLLPSLGEGITEGTIVSILIAEGDILEKEQAVVEIETDKVTMEVPSSIEGTVTNIMVQEGDLIQVGAVLCSIASDDSVAEEAAPNIDSTQVLREVPPPLAEDQPTQKRKAIPQNPAIRRERKEGIRSTPKGKKLARELGLSMAAMPADQDVILEADVKSYIKNHSGLQEESLSTQMELPEFSRWGNVRTESMPAIMKATAENMLRSSREIPHAWLQGEVDVTVTEQHRKELNKQYDLKISLTVFITKAVSKALQDYPKFNASLDYRSKEIFYKDYIHVGVAVDTKHGLFVPVIKDVDRLSLSQIATTLTDLAGRAKDKKLKMGELEGGNFTISNLGGFGTSAIFPLILPPQVAILGVASYVMRDGRKYLPLTIGFDHRIIDGADAGRFLQKLKSYLSNPVRILI